MAFLYTGRERVSVRRGRGLVLGEGGGDGRRGGKRKDEREERREEEG